MVKLARNEQCITLHPLTARGETGPLRESGIRGLRTAGLYPLAGLLDYEDTRLKTSSRVRMGLYLAQKAS